MTQASSVMRRKAGADRPPPEYGHMTSDKALRLALSKATQDVLRVPLTIGDVASMRWSVPAMVKTLPVTALTQIIKRGSSLRGILSLDSGALAAVLEAQTTGKISPREVPDRRPTPTDAMMAKRFSQLLLNSFTTNLEEQPSAIWAAGFQLHDMVPELRRLPHLLEDVAFNGFQADVTFGADGRGGKIYLFMPEPPKGMGRSTQEPAEVFVDPWEGALHALVMDSPAVVEAVLHRFRLPLARVAGLQPGDQLIFPARKLGEMTLEGADGAAIGSCRLGATDGMRAICVTDADPAGQDGAVPSGHAGSLAAGPAGADQNDEAQIRSANLEADLAEIAAQGLPPALPDPA